MDMNMVSESFQAFHVNGLNGLIYAFSTNWCLILLVIAAAASVILGIADQNATTVHEEQNII